MTLEQTLEARLKKKQQILFSKDDPCIQAIQSVLDTCSRIGIVCWALEQAEDATAKLEQLCPGDLRVRTALDTTQLWAKGHVKMPAAKRAILECHAAAKETSSPEAAALYHAIGQACAVVHTTGHAVGYPLYALTALIRAEGTADCESRIQERILFYLERLQYWNAQQFHDDDWAPFLQP